MRIAVDVGLGYVKAMNEYGKIVKFPSVVDFQIGSDITNSLGGYVVGEDYKIGLLDKVGENKKTFLVGNAAMSIGGKRSIEEGKVSQRNLDVLIFTAVVLLLNGSEEAVDLAVGLPMRDYDQMKQDLKKRYINYNQNLTFEQKEIEIDIKSVFVFPQEAGAYFASIFGVDGEVENVNLLNKPLAVVLIGHTKTNYLYMMNTKNGLEPSTSLSGSMDFGANDVFELTTDSIYEEVKGRMRKKGLNPKPVNIDDVEKSVLSFENILVHQSEDYKLANHFEASARKISNSITDRLNLLWKDNIDTLTSIMIGGDGCDPLFNYMEKAFERSGIQKIDEPIFAKAKGYLAAQALTLELESCDVK